MQKEVSGSKKEAQAQAAFALKWLREIQRVKESREQRRFEKVGEKIVKKYKNDHTHDAFQNQTLPNARVMFNILWSIVQVLKPSLYARMPKVVVERRFKDSDPIARLACNGAERAASYMLASQQDRFNYAVRAAVEDRLLPGRGQVWLRYDAEFEPLKDEQGNPVIGEDGKPVEVQKPGSESVFVDPLYWQDYLESKARNQFEVRWRAKRHWMVRSELCKEFGDVGKQVQITVDKRRKDDDESIQEAEVWQIADYQGKQIIWVSEGYKDGPLKVVSDPYKLKGFWPCPLPLVATTASDSTYPTPDFVIYERLADEIDYVTKRLSSIVESVRFVGAHAAALSKDIKNILDLRDGQTFPIQNWQAFADQKGGLAGAINWWPFEKAVSLIEPLTAYRDRLLQDVFEITGIPDIVRGSTDPNETLGAQQQKGRWTVVKLQEKQAEVQRFCREIISKVAEIIFEPGFFSDDSIALMAGVAQMPQEDQENWPQALQLLRDDRLRTFRVDIETDSTIAIDEEMETERWMNYMQAVQGIVSEIQGVTQFRPELMHPIIETAKAAMRAFRTGRSVEGAWEKALQEIEDNDAAAAQQAQENPQPDYEMIKLQVEQAKASTEQAKAEVMQIEIGLKQQAQEFEQFFKGQELASKNQWEQAKFHIESQKVEVEAIKANAKAQIDQINAELEAFKEQFAQFARTQELDLEKYRVVADQEERMMTEERLQEEHTLKLNNQIAQAQKAKLEAIKTVKEISEPKKEK